MVEANPVAAVPGEGEEEGEGDGDGVGYQLCGGYPEPLAGTVSKSENSFARSSKDVGCSCSGVGGDYQSDNRLCHRLSSNAFVMQAIIELTTKLDLIF